MLALRGRRRRPGGLAMDKADAGIGRAEPAWRVPSAWTRVAALGVLCGTVVVASCGDDPGEVSDVRFEDIRAALDSEAGSGGLEPFKGKTVRWSGRVVEALRQRGDDYVEEGVLLVDMDAAGQRPEPDVTFNVRPSQLDALEAGRPVAFVGVVREMQRGVAGETLLRLELKRLEGP